MGKETTLTIAIFFMIILYVGMLTLLYRAFNERGIKAGKFSKNNIKRNAVNFDHKAFSSLNAFEMPMFYELKGCGYSVSKIHVSKFRWQYYSLFYFKRKNSLLGAIANFKEPEGFLIGAPSPIDGVTYCGKEQIRVFQPSLVKAIFGSSEAFVEISAIGTLFGFRAAATTEGELAELYAICEKFLQEIKKVS